MLNIPGLRKTSCKGQSMVEFAVCLPIFVLIFTGILFFGKGFVIAQRAAMAARYVSFRFAKKEDTPITEVQTRVKSVFGFEYRISNKKTGFGDGFVSGLSAITSAGGGRSTSVSIPYEPNYLAFNPGGINIGHTVVVDGGTWTYDELGSDSLLGVLLRQLFGAFADLITGNKDSNVDTGPPGDSRPSEQDEPSGTPQISF